MARQTAAQRAEAMLAYTTEVGRLIQEMRGVLALYVKGPGHGLTCGCDACLAAHRLIRAPLPELGRATAPRLAVAEAPPPPPQAETPGGQVVGVGGAYLVPADPAGRVPTAQQAWARISDQLAALEADPEQLAMLADLERAQREATGKG